MLPSATLYTRLFPFLAWLQTTTKQTLKADCFAGISGAIIVLPQGVAFATIAGLPPEYGLYSAIVPAIIAALFGSSHHLISGPTTAISLVIFANLSGFYQPFTPEYIAAALTLTLLTGIVQLAFGLAKLGALVNFISHSVVVGFTAGAAILIGFSQLGNFLGIQLPDGMHLFEQVIWTVRHMHTVNTSALITASVTLFVALASKLLWPHLPGLLFAMVIGSLTAIFLGGESAGISLVGSLPASLPGLSLPDVTLTTLQQLAPSAFAIAILGLTEAVSIARSVATHSHQRINTNQEFIGQGLSNVIGSFFSCYAASGSFTRTGVNYTAGAKTPMAAIFAALFLAGILLLVAPLTAYLPIASMAGVLMLVAYRLIDFHHIRSIMRTSRSEFAILAVTFLATLLLKLEFAIYVGVLLSLLLYLNKTSHPDFVPLAPSANTGGARSFVNSIGTRAAECPQLKIVRLDGEVYFGAINHIIESLHQIIEKSPEQCHILLVCKGVSFIDVAGCDMLSHEDHSLRLSGRQLYLCSLKSNVYGMLHKAGVIQTIGTENIFPNKHVAIGAITKRLDPERCRHCKVRIFEECKDRPSRELPLF